jgi:2-keto-3-deoxy-L-rhamnonate aldolase RhmA
MSPIVTRFPAKLPATVLLFAAFGAGHQQPKHFNPVVDLLAQHKSVFGLYIPANPRGRGGRGSTSGAAPTAAPTTPSPTRTEAELAKEAVAYTGADFLFDGSTEDPARFANSYGIFGEFVDGMANAHPIAEAPIRHITHPLFVKTPIIAADTALARVRIGRQLDLGVSGIMFVGVESADEVKEGLAMMRFRSKGGTRSDSVGGAPAWWGLSKAEYREKADVWPLDPNGELVNFTVVESREGLAHVREIAAVKGIGVLFPGAGTLGQVFSSVDSVTGRRVRDSVGWEGAIQQVLSACKEFNVPCGYPANDTTMIRYRLNQGFTVFVSGWGQNGFSAVDLGKKLSGR